LIFREKAYEEVNMVLLERYIRSVLLERGRFSSGSGFDAYLIGLNCEGKELVRLVEKVKESNSLLKGVNNPFGYLQIFKKQKEIIDILKQELGKDSVDDLGIEFDDDLPIIVRIIQGDNTSKEKSGKLSLQDNLDWMVHDTWHLIVDRSFWIKKFLNKSVHISQTLEYYIDNSIVADDIRPDFEKDCLMFLSSYNFTSGVGEFDCVPSLAAFCAMNKEIRSVPVEFKGKMKNYEGFNEFYSMLHVMSPLLWKAIFKSLRGKLIFNHF
jgi:hypothetical protein